MKIILTLQASTLRPITLGISLVVQGLRLLLPMQGVRVQSLVGKLHGQKTNNIFVSIHSFYFRESTWTQKNRTNDIKHPYAPQKAPLKTNVLAFCCICFILTLRIQLHIFKYLASSLEAAFEVYQFQKYFLKTRKILNKWSTLKKYICIF